MNISEKGLELIALFEGFRAMPYDDVVGKKTVGYGHLLLPGDNIEYPMTKESAKELMKKDVQWCVDTLKKGVSVPLTQNQFDALCSFIYNIGQGAFLKSTLRKLLNVGKYEKASIEFLKWSNAGGRSILGLLNRRLAEQKLFTTLDKKVL